MQDQFLYYTLNKFIACAPYKGREAHKGSLFAEWQLQNPIVELEVLLKDDEAMVKPGDKVYLRPFLELPSYLKETFNFDGTDVVLVPRDFVVAVKVS